MNWIWSSSSSSSFFFDDVAEGGERTETKFNAGMIFLSFFLLLIILCGGKIGLLMSRTRTSLFHPQVMHIYVSKKTYRCRMIWILYWSFLLVVIIINIIIIYADGEQQQREEEEDQCDEKYQFLLRRLSKKRKRHRLAFYSTLQQAWHPVFLRLGVSRQTDWLTDWLTVLLMTNIICDCLLCYKSKIDIELFIRRKYNNTQIDQITNQGPQLD